MVREEKDRVEKRKNRRMKGRMKAWRERGGKEPRRSRYGGKGETGRRERNDGWTGQEKE